MINGALLKVAAVTKTYTVGGVQTQVLKGIDLHLAAGDTTAIVGPSGSGKSTLLNIIGLLDSPSSGSVILEGKDISGLSEQESSHLRNRRIGFVFQMHHLLPQCSVLDNVLLPTLASPQTAQQKKDAFCRAQSLLERVGLADLLHHRPGQLSAGQRQRAALVRALINTPALLLADEPTGALDAATGRQIAELMLDLNQQEKTAMIVATHSMPLALAMGQCCLLQDGILKPYANSMPFMKEPRDK